MLASLVASGVAGYVLREPLREAAAPLERKYFEWRQSRLSAALGRADAERDWKAGTPQLVADGRTIVTDLPHGIHVSSFDLATGLPFKSSVEQGGCILIVYDEPYTAAYNAQIHKRIATDGLPPNSRLGWIELARRLPELAEAATWRAVDDAVREKWIVYGNSRVFVADVAEDPALQLVRVSTPYYGNVAWVDCYLTEVGTGATVARVEYRSSGSSE